VSHEVRGTEAALNQSCLDIQSHLSAWFDGELTDDLKEVVDTHLVDCSECGQVAESLRNLDAKFANSATIWNEAAARIAVNVLDAVAKRPGDDLRPASVAHTKPRHNTRPDTLAERTPVPEERISNEFRSHSSRPPAFQKGRVLSPLVAAVAGFLLAWLIFAPSSREVARNDQTQPHVEVLVETPAPAPVKPSLARFVASTGSVEVRQSSQAEWSEVCDLNSFRCPSGTEVRTPAGVCCELETGDRCTIRLNEATELAIRSPHEIELRSGQVWCSATSSAELQVVAATFPRTKSNVNPPNANPFACWTCPANGSLISEVDSVGNCRVQCANGDVHVSLGETKQRLKQGEIARFDNGRLRIESHHADALLMTTWMQPLLVLKGHENPELGDRVNRLLANLGRSKLEHLYEDEIRGLGEFATLPLLRFVQSEASHQTPDQRLRAMLIFTDIAPSWLVGDLIGLLADREPQVRVQAALALERLTRQSQGRAPMQWSAPLPELQESLNQWHRWWERNSQRYDQRQKGADTTQEKTA